MVFWEILGETLSCVCVDLMKAFVDSQKLMFIPEFVQEGGDFKSLIKGYHHGGNNALIGLGSKHIFQVLCGS